MLDAFRVLDLTAERGQLCSAILASLGAEVVLLEPPGGSRARRVGPFAGGVEDPERSLRFWAHNRGKASVTLDLASASGRAQALALADGADLLVVDDLAAREAEGLAYETLAARNPALVYVAITPFGATGPKAAWPATDLTVLAAGGSLGLNGDADRPPVRPGPEGQGWFHASAEAAGAALIALYERQSRSGLGQFVDVSAQQAANVAAGSQMLAAALGATPSRRSGRGVALAGRELQLTFPCKDGFVICMLLFGAAMGPFTARLMRWMLEEGACDQAMVEVDWIGYGLGLFDGSTPFSHYDEVKAAVGAFLAGKTKAELLDAALSRKLLFAPVVTTKDVYESEQFAAREVWDTVDHGEHGKLRMPGRFAVFSKTPLRPLPAAPRLGADNERVLAAPRRPANAAAPRTPAVEPPLAGVKVLDLMWVMAGPAASRVLADHGATIVRVESAAHIDAARTLQPFRNDEGNAEYSGLFNNLNAGKLGLALRLDEPAGREVLLDLVAWADVVLESYSPGVLERWGLGYDAMRRVNPEVILASSCLYGQHGPHSGLAGFGTMAAAAAGFHNLCGWPDRSPAGPFGAYTDTVSPRFLLAAVMAALLHRQATGVGQRIDLSQAEASLPLLTTALLDFEANGVVAQRQGNDDERCCPHGVYPAAGEDQWLAVACETDAQWAALAAALGRSDLAGLDAAQRRARRAELDDALSAWSRTRPADASAEQLAGAGVPAHKVNTSADFLTDPQLRHRHHQVTVPHPAQPGGETVVEGARFTLSRTPASITRAGPTLGQHASEVLADILGYDDERIAELAAAGLLE
ncbi:MAG: CaiB/BaiF CoA transferase family protein [Acidimicrobiales bacterium]